VNFAGPIQDNISYSFLDMCQSISHDHVYLLDNCTVPEAVAISAVYNNAERNGLCAKNGSQFFCEAVNFLCDGSINSSIPLNEECGRVRDDYCVVEWRIIESLLNLSLPNCSIFNEDTNQTVSYSPQSPCPDNFRRFCGSLCFPLCGEPILTENLEDVYNIMLICLYFINLTGGVITLIASIIRRETM